jgi:hypothetical protein
MKINSLRIILFISFFLFAFLLKGKEVTFPKELKVDAKTKPAKAYTSYPTRIVDQLPLIKESNVIKTNVYGSRTDKRTKATGFFRAELINNRWWVVDPEGYLNICRGVNEIKVGKGNISKVVFGEKYDNNSTFWMRNTMEYLQGLGFNCAGSWSKTDEITSNPRQQTKPLAYTVILNWMSGYGSSRTHQADGHMGYPNNAIFVFEKGFEAYCNNKAKELAENKYDKNLFGYFTDNELPFLNKSLTNFLKLGINSATDENYLATKKWLDENGFSEADTINADVKAKFLAYVGDTYARIVNNAMKKYDPNHMNLGPRVNYKEALNNSYFMKAFGKNVEILAINYYGVWTPDSTSMSNWGKSLQKPIMITEFYTKGEDSGLGNKAGAGWIVKTQLDRGYAYQHFTLALLESKYCVGWHWFKYMDNDPSTSADPSNTDGNKGIVKINYEPYIPLADKMKELNFRVYNLIDYFDNAK